jgi:hypothetical protein
MKIQRHIFFVLLTIGELYAVLLTSSCTSETIPQQDLQQIFNNCPEQAKPWTWWHWMNGNVTKSGITNDLEEIKKAGLGGVHIFNVTDRIVEGPVTFLSQEWMNLTLFAIEEADRIGLQTGIHNCPGWSASGGPWIEPKNAMKQILFSEYYLEGGTKIEIDLPVPTGQEYYEDIKVLAFPSLKGDGIGDESRFKSWKAKTGNTINAFTTLPPIETDDSGKIIDSKAIVDVSKYMDASGRLSWDAPKGNWTIVRFGYTYLKRTNRAAPLVGTGLECDKFDTVAMKTHFDAYARKIIEMAHPYTGKSFNVLVIDSYEGGVQTWTASFMQEFAKRRGYDMTAWLPCLTGRIVGSPELTDRFLCDYRLTISDLYRDHYYGYMRKLVSAYGMKLFIEPYGDYNINPIDIGSQADEIAIEFWINPKYWNGLNQIKAISSTANIYDKRIVDSEAFTSRPPDIFNITPHELKTYADKVYIQGVNKLTFHSYPHQPRPDIKPGMSMGPHGTFFSSTNTWWEPGEALFRYFTRCNALLQQGLYAADFLNYIGDVAPWTTEMSESGYENLNYYNGYSFDYCNTDVLLNRISIKKGKISLPGGMTYDLLVLPPSASININVLEKIQSLVKEGMIVVGERPEISQGLKGYPDNDAQVKRIASQLWGEDQSPSGVHSYGKGRVFWGKTVEQTLQELSIAPGFVCKAVDSDVDVQVIHRRSGDDDIYFLANLSDKMGRANCFFRTKGKLPELWDPATGDMKTLAVYSKSKDGVTVPLFFESNGSMFIIFRKSDKNFDPVEDITFEGKSVAAQGILSIPNVYINESGELKIDAFETGNYVVSRASSVKQQFVVDKTDNVIDISDKWEVRFDPVMGGVGNVSFEKLNSWSVDANPEIKYYSGTAIYKKNFNIPESMYGGRIYLTFERIADLGRVVVNGAECAVLWTPPYRVDITKYVKAGDNTIEVGVTNTWNNRLVGDERYPDNHKFTELAEDFLKNTLAIAEFPDWYTQGLPKPDNNRVAFVTWKHYTLDSPLYDAGITGAVKIITQINKDVENK